MEGYNVLRFFEFEHLPIRLQEVSEPFHDLAHDLNNTLPEGVEKATALRKFLEAKDCAVRSML